MLQTSSYPSLFIMNGAHPNNNLNPTPVSVAALRGLSRGGAGLEKRYVPITKICKVQVS